MRIVIDPGHAGRNVDPGAVNQSTGLQEADVALFAIKGLSTAEIAALRQTSEGTVKAQTNAIYRKAGVSGRSQLLSLLIEDLMRDDGVVRAKLAQSAA